MPLLDINVLKGYNSIRYTMYEVILKDLDKVELRQNLDEPHNQQIDIVDPTSTIVRHLMRRLSLTLKKGFSGQCIGFCTGNKGFNLRGRLYIKINDL